MVRYQRFDAIWRVVMIEALPRYYGELAEWLKAAVCLPTADLPKGD